MEGKAKPTFLEKQIDDSRTKARLAHFHRDGEWVKRGDVRIKFLDRHGKLTVGYGSKNCIGPELDFGFAVGDELDAPVLIIKTAWGGKSLSRDFRPPSSGVPTDRVIQDLLAKAQRRKPETKAEDIEHAFGAYYRLMMDDIKQTLDQIEEYVPEGDRCYEIAGFAWFQGWNDMVNPEYTAAYRENMANFVRDVRNDLGEPDLPFVIDVLGVGGEEDQAAGKQRFKEAQSAVGEMPEFKGNVAIVQTDQFWDEVAAAVFKKGWRQNPKEWNTVGSDYPFHYSGSPSTYSDIGRAMAEALLQLSTRPSGSSASD